MTRSSVLPIPGTTPKAQRTRRSLLDAAERVFGEKGFDATSINEITREAGFAQGTFYLYFFDKRTIFIALVEELGRSLRAALGAAVKDVTPRLEAERAGFRAFFQFAAAHRDLYRIVRQAEFVDRASYRAYYAVLAEGYARGLRKAMAAGEVYRTDPEMLAWCLMGIGDFLGMRGILWEETADVEALTTAAMTLLEHGLAPQMPAAPPTVVRRASPSSPPPAPKKKPRATRGKP